MQPITRAVTARVPAKINLALAVGDLRPDGYHDLATVFHAVNLFDEVTATDGLPGAGIRLSISGDGVEEVPVDDSNLAWQAARMLADYADVAMDVNIAINKNIPVAAGLAGGSADAAAALIACDALWRVGLGREEFDVLAARLGADVTFALHGGTAIGSSRGEVLTPALITGQFDWVLAVAEKGLSTPAVYRECDRLREGREISEPAIPDALMAALRKGNAKALGASLSNDLQPAAISLRPGLELVLEAGLAAGALGGIVSGSGPTCAFLVDDREQALDVAASLTGSGTCRTAIHVSGPVHGARVVESGTNGTILGMR